MKTRLQTLLIALPLAYLLGCGGGESFPTAPTSGKVMLGGQPVKGGSIQFSPVATAEGKSPGKPGSAIVNEDGTFTLSTYGNDDGAVVGKHTVTYTPPSIDAAEEPADGGHAEQKKSPYEGLTPKQKEVDVKEGKNEFTIDLEKSAQ